ncbi:MAG: ABC transporter substrate-binding protein [Planctomycetes bacterium]|nr:ABC transporter substrate-binding protein [Planctomycetota bacterium]
MKRLIALLLVGIAMLGAGEPRRIVSIDPAVTETVFQFGHGGAVVATDMTSTWPAAAAALPKLGYIRQLNAEGIIAQRPDLVLTSDKLQPRMVIEQLQQAGITVRELPGAADLPALRQRLLGVGEALGESAQAQRLYDGITARIDAVARRHPAGGTGPRVLFILHLMGGDVVCGGSGTAADWLIRACGGRNGIDAPGYKPVGAEALLAMRPDVVVAMSTGPSGPMTRERIVAHHALTGLAAVQSGRVHLVDGTLMLGFGPRLGEAVEAFADLLHGDGAAQR